MKQTRKMRAAILSAGILLGAMPVMPVFAEETDSPADEPVVMNATITLNGDSAAAEGDNVKVEGSKITVSASGAYAFSGTLTNGQIIVNVPDTAADAGTVKLFFNGVNITGLTEAPVYVINAKKTSINLADGTENILSDGETYTDTNAVIYAKDDLTIKSGGTAGDGKLKIQATYQQGIQCNNDLKITGGEIKIKTEAADALRGKDSVEIKGGKLDINAGGDGVKSTKGSVTISGGDTEIKAANDAVQGETEVSILGGSLKANGDRGLTNANADGSGVLIGTAATVLATATDQQAVLKTVTDAAEPEKNSAPALLFKTSEELLKDQRIEVKETGSETAVFSKNPNKKFSYGVIASPELAAGKSYDLYIGGAAAEKGTFTLKAVADGFTTLEGVVCKAAPPEAEKTERNLDINNDGDVDVSDAVMLSRFIAEDPEVTMDSIAISRSDTNGDGQTASDDVMVILRKIAHLD